jgi:D-arabinose 1-dehydrogenase-like Zn-dependent alcohol dehydrogenase
VESEISELSDVCPTDVLIIEGSWPGISYPRLPGHNVVGIVDDVGSGVLEWRVGQRVGVGWHGGHDGICHERRRGDFPNCRNHQIVGNIAITQRQRCSYLCVALRIAVENFHAANCLLASFGVTSFSSPVDKSRTNARITTSVGIHGCDLSFSACFCVCRFTSE